MFVGFYYRVPPSVDVLTKHNDIVNAFSFSWSAATNVWATGMIAYKAWYVNPITLQFRVLSSGIV